MDATKMKFNAAEICAATGITPKELSARRTLLIRSGEIQAVKGSREYSYDEVRKLCRKPRKPGEQRPEYVTALKKQLQLDGYTIAK